MKTMKHDEYVANHSMSGGILGGKNLCSRVRSKCDAVWRIAALFAVIAMIAPSCGGGSGFVGKGLTIPEDNTFATADKVLEGYIYAPSETARTAGGKKSEKNAVRDAALGLEADILSYIPFASATVTATCGKISKSTTTDSTGYYKVENLPSGTCKVSAKKGGTETPEQEVEIDKDEEEATGISWTTDNRLLGRAMFEDGDKHNGITVTIKQGDYEKQTNTNAEGIYVFPAASQLDDGEVTVEARTDGCDFYMSSSITFTIQNGIFSEGSVKDMTLMKLVKYSVSVSDNNFQNSPLKACLKLEYRGKEEKTIFCPNNIPHFYLINYSNGEVIKGPAYTLPEPTIVDLNQGTSYIVCEYINWVPWPLENNDEYSLYMTLCDSDIPICAGTYEDVMEPAVVRYTSQQ